MKVASFLSSFESVLAGGWKNAVEIFGRGYLGISKIESIYLVYFPLSVASSDYLSCFTVESGTFSSERLFFIGVD